MLFSLFSRKTIFILIALLFAAGAILSAWNIIVHTEGSTTAIEKILVHYSLQNEGAQSLAQYSKEHPVLGAIVSSPLKHTLELPSQEEANKALHSDIKRLLKTVREESFVAAWWSCFLLNFSLLYIVLVISLEGGFTTRFVLFALSCVCLIFFVIGIVAPAMVIWTAPSIPLETGTLNFVVQHQVRGIAAVIKDLLTSNHWIVGGFLLLFSVITPLTKISLTFFATASHSKTVNLRIARLLHAIGKWSMADVLVAAILLSLYALKFQEATKSISCLGLYYFTGYCLLSMTTTEFLIRSEATNETERKPKKKLGGNIIIGLFAVFVCFALASSYYTYEEYTLNLKENIKASTLPQQLDNADLVLPAHN